MKKSFFYTNKNSILQVVLVALVLGGLFLGGLFSTGAGNSPYPELAKLASMSGSFVTYAPYFNTLAEEKGAVYAFEVLKRAPLPPNIDLHLLGHVVGDELYKQKGIQGIENCTNDFRNACSHSIVVGALLERGEGALPDIADACRKAPGGTGAYTMCFHGLGHGILAYFQYELPPTIKFCERVGTKEYRNREYIECVGGAIMELLSGGGHDKLTWERVRQKYLRESDPLYPCDASFMPPLVKPNCYQYITPHLFEAAGADLGYPTPQNFADAFTFCKKVPRSDTEDRSNCFGGFGKEFVVLAQNRDIRKIEEMTSEQLARVVDWCELADDAKGTLDCDNSAVQSLYWGGENNPDAALRFCTVVPKGNRQDNCFSELTGAVSFYVSDTAYRTALCDRYPAHYAGMCRIRLLTNDSK